MKNQIISVLMIISLSVLISCGTSNNKSADISGEWKLSALESNDNGVIELTDCDKSTVWNFTNEEAEPLGDGTEVKKLKVTAPAECKFFDFESKWTIIDDKVFISSSRVGGIGGFSHAGMFDLVENTETKLVLKILKTTYTFVK